MFQSPIGTNKTDYDKMVNEIIDYVSIPYRYKQNWLCRKI